MFFSKLIPVLILLMMLFQANFAQNSKPIDPGNEDALNDDSLCCAFFKISESDELKCQDKWFGTDKGRHLLGSAICTIGATKCLQRSADADQRKSLFIGAGFTLSLGMAKECRDATEAKNHFSYKDLIADIIGVIIGGFLVSID